MLGGEIQGPNDVCFQSTGLTRYQLSTAGVMPMFTLGATFPPPPPIPPLTASPEVRPPSAFDDRYAYLIWLNTDSYGNPTGLGAIHKADPLTLQPIPGDNPIPLATPGGVSPPLSGDLVGNVLVGAYTYTGAGPSSARSN